MKKIFITSVTGAQGRSIARAFNDSGYIIHSMVRKIADIDGIKTVVGEFSETQKLASAMQGSEAIVLTLPLLFDSAVIVAITKQIVYAAKSAGVNKIIFNSSIPFGESKTGYAAIDVKHDALQVLNESGLEIVTLMPTIYLDNLSAPFLLPVIKELKIVPYPIADKLNFNWISHENLGRYCVAAVNDPSLVSEKILISNRDNLSKQQVVDLIGQSMQKNLHYVATTPDQFEGNLRPVLGDVIAKEIANLYRGIAENPSEFTHYSHIEFLDSVKLQSTEEWVSSVIW